MDQPLYIIYTSTQYHHVVSGPGRFAEYLRQLKSEKLQLYFVADQITHPNPQEQPAKYIPWLAKLPFYWVFRAWFFARATNKLIKKKPIDAILCSSAFEAIFLKNPGVPVFVMVNDYNYAVAPFRQLLKSTSFSKALARSIYHYLEKWLVQRADFMVANSLFNKKIIEEAYNLHFSRSRLLYKVVDLSYFRFQEKEMQPPKNILFIKNDYKRGGLAVIIKALARLPFQQELTFVVAGVENKNEVEKMALDAGFKGKLRIEGLINRERVLTLQRDADLFINLAYQEALGVSCLESLACGTPVIASNVGGLPEVLNHGEAGFLLEPGDESGLTALIEKLWTRPELMKDKVENGRLHAEKFDLNHLDQHLYDVFNPILPLK